MRRMISKYMRFLLPLSVVAVLIVSCFLPWMSFEKSGITVTGLNPAGLPIGRPAYFHFFNTGLFLLFYLFNQVWSRIVAFAFTVLNGVWAFKNFIALPACSGGSVECPVRRIGLYLLLITSVVLIFAGLLAPVKQRANGEHSPK